MKRSTSVKMPVSRPMIAPNSVTVIPRSGDGERGC